MFSLLPTATHAETTSAYAEAAIEFSNQTYKPNNAVGEPDESYADFLMKDAFVTLDFGQEIESHLTLHMLLLNFGATVRVDFLDADKAKITSASKIFDIAQPEVTLEYTGGEPYRYAKVVSVKPEVWKLDAVEVLLPEMTEEDSPSEEPTEEEPVAEEEGSEEAVTRGMLIKLADDGNPDTETDAAVYAVDGNGMRHAFPNETVFLSWYKSFDDVRIVSAEEMASYALGKNVTMRPGTHLVKITANPNVYAVEPEGTLRWIANEEVATDLYGTNWATRVRDVPDVFWGNYQLGEPVETAIHPEGTVGVSEAGEVLYVKNGVYYSIPGTTHGFMRFNPNFYTLIQDELLDLYVSLGSLGQDPDIAFPY